jgi:hypothetical protein
MNESENKTADTSEISELKAQCAQMSKQITTLLIAVVVCSVTYAGFVGLQIRRLGKDLESLRPEGQRATEALAKETPHIQEFMAKLAEYGRTHPDFQPIMVKYGLTNSGPAAPVPLGSKK